MALIDDIDFYSHAVRAGELTRDAAAAALAEASNGGLTLRGARESIDKWLAARPEYRQTLSDAASGLDRA